MPWHSFNAPLLALFLLATAGGAMAYVVLRRRGRPRVARPLGIAVLLWVSAYLSLLVNVSLHSEETVLDLGQIKRFCGFYLDCHLGVAVADIRRMPSLGDGANVRFPQGIFYAITVDVSSNAREATLQLHRPDAVILAEDGSRYGRDRAAEQLFAFNTRLTESIPAGNRRLATIIFDVPRDAPNPRLWITEGRGLWPDRLFELLLIGDEDSLFHGATTFRLS
jgi:hypothetical protein